MDFFFFSKSLMLWLLHWARAYCPFSTQVSSSLCYVSVIPYLRWVQGAEQDLLWPIILFLWQLEPLYDLQGFARHLNGVFFVLTLSFAISLKRIFSWLYALIAEIWLKTACSTVKHIHFHLVPVYCLEHCKSVSSSRCFHLFLHLLQLLVWQCSPEAEF